MNLIQENIASGTSSLCNQAFAITFSALVAGVCERRQGWYHALTCGDDLNLLAKPLQALHAIVGPQ